MKANGESFGVSDERGLAGISEGAMGELVSVLGVVGSVSVWIGLRLHDDDKWAPPAGMVLSLLGMMVEIVVDIVRASL